MAAPPPRRRSAGQPERHCQPRSPPTSPFRVQPADSLWSLLSRVFSSMFSSMFSLVPIQLVSVRLPRTVAIGSDKQRGALTED